MYTVCCLRSSHVLLWNSGMVGTTADGGKMIAGADDVDAADDGKKIAGADDVGGVTGTCVKVPGVGSLLTPPPLDEARPVRFFTTAVITFHLL